MAVSSVGNSHQALGVLQEIDLVQRAVKVLVEGRLVDFDVDPDCVVLLHGERVKLRLLQPLDYAAITYVTVEGTPRARALKVNWWWPGSEDAWQRRYTQARAAQTT